ncbi:serine hydrolase [Sphingomonas sp. LM7]|uniref:serine hydrolase n=1 Tax=Sphingomonas sp. LM7 TaxID=1938607 RepID=UPI000983F3AC|nr:serine hydrolase [Sphingomonas sp. LM7]AQR75801.1 hypothetical protein BXU08_09590 [Sphingomonas sp. LM7]
MRRFLLPIALLGLTMPLAAQTPPLPATVEASPALQARIRELVSLLAGKGDYADLFAAGFQANVPKAKLDAIIAQLLAANGPVHGVETIVADTSHSATVRIAYRDATATLQIAVEPNAPHRVSALLIRDVGARETTLAATTEALRQLHGTTGYALARLGPDGPTLLEAHQADTPLAVGSAFKLVILAELVRATSAGERTWSDMATLDGSHLPGGAYFGRPKGTQVSLAELAEKMIAVSDNSATDILLHTLGRDKVEAMLPVLGVRDPARNRPFLATLEAFKLKYLTDGSYARRYFALDDAGKRALLAGELARIPLIALPPAPPEGRAPAMIDQVEWFFSPADLVRMMDWLRRNTEGAKGAEARAILSKNPGIPPAAAGKWQWIGYKGGSETGVMNMTLLLQAKRGDWYVLTSSWNDTARAVEETRFASLITRFAELAAP